MYPNNPVINDAYAICLPFQTMSIWFCCRRRCCRWVVVLFIVAVVAVDFTVVVTTGKNTPEYITVLRTIFLLQKGRDLCYYFVSENGWSKPPLMGKSNL